MYHVSINYLQRRKIERCYTISVKLNDLLFCMSLAFITALRSSRDVQPKDAQVKIDCPLSLKPLDSVIFEDVH